VKKGEGKKLVKEAEKEIQTARTFTHVLGDAGREERLDLLENRLAEVREYMVKVTVSTERKGGKETERVKKIKRVSLGKEPFKVVASVGLTINLGNYESARVNAGLEYPTDRDGIDDAFKEAWGIIETELANEVKDIKAKTKVDMKEE